MSKSDDVRLILCSDIHLSERPPIFRSDEPDWFEAMARPLRELQDTADQYQAKVVCAGDIFDKWNPSPALINFAIDELPLMYAVPGQHDLPHHRYTDIKSSAYWTLVKAGKIINLEPDKPIEVNGVVLHGFPWNSELKPCTSSDLCLHLAVVHKYIWSDETNHFPGADSDDHISGWKIRGLAGFDAMVFGDNHKGFLAKTHAGAATILNSGGFMRRKRDEIDYTPSFALMYGDGKIERWALNCKHDTYLEQDDVREVSDEKLDLEGFISELRQLGGDELDFTSALRLYCETHDVDKETREIVMETIQ